MKKELTDYVFLSYVLITSVFCLGVAYGLLIKFF